MFLLPPQPGVDDSESKIDPLSPAALPDGAATPAGDAPPDADDAAVTGGDDDAVDAAGVGISLQGDEPGPAAVQPESVHNPVSV